METEPKVEVRKLSDFLPAKVNPNAGNEHSVPMIVDSIQINGAGRPMLADKDGEMIAGSHSLQAFIDAGFEDAIVITGDGKRPIIYIREDIDIEDPRGRSLQVGDNRIGQKSFTPDNELLGAILADIAEQDAALVKAAGYNQAELNTLLNAGTDNPYDEWVGMPEFEQEDASAPYSIKVNFLTLDAIAEFAALVGQRITEKTVYINYPYRPDEDLKRYKATDES